MSDNFKIEVASEGRELFGQAMSIAFKDRCEAAAMGVHNGTLVFFWADPPKVDGLEILNTGLDLTEENCTEFAYRWVHSQDYGDEPDHDGHNKPGWRVFNEDWGHVAAMWQAFVGVQPCWMMYGK